MTVALVTMSAAVVILATALTLLIRRLHKVSDRAERLLVEGTEAQALIVEWKAAHDKLEAALKEKQAECDGEFAARMRAEERASVLVKKLASVPGAALDNLNERLREMSEATTDPASHTRPSDGTVHAEITDGNLTPVERPGRRPEKP